MQLTIAQGTITLPVQPGEIKFGDGMRKPLWERKPTGGSLSIVKDADNQLKFFHTQEGGVDTQIAYDVSDLDPTVEHKIAAAWSVPRGELALYIDGDQVASAMM